jgi:DNA-binding Lrp family transcriptional regulator
MRKTILLNDDLKRKTIDHLDIEILNVLQKDCRLSFNKVAAETQVSVGTAYNRVKSLEARNYVKGYTIIVDSTKMDFPLTAVIFVQAEGGHMPEVEKEIAHKSNVVAVYDITGEFDAVVVAKFRGREDLNAFIKQLATIVHVKRTITSVSLNTVKEDFRIQLA